MELLPRCFSIAIQSNSHIQALHLQFSARFAILLYTKSSNVELVDEARLELFCHDNKTICMEDISPTTGALLQHMMQSKQPIRLHYK